VNIPTGEKRAAADCRMAAIRYYVCKSGDNWKLCPCGWRPELGKHYANPEVVKFQRMRRMSPGFFFIFMIFFVSAMRSPPVGSKHVTPN
jgi:hypothetical protein